MPVLLVALLLVAGGAVVYRTVDGSSAVAARTAAATYLTALERGDGATAYGLWCAPDQAVYPQVQFRAQHAWRQGHAVHLGLAHTAVGGGGSSAWVSYALDGEGDMQPMAMLRTAGRWQVCPGGARLQQDMQNCGCMTVTDKLEADVAHVVDRRYDLAEVTCPTQLTLADQVPVRCSGTSVDGRRWSLVATESDAATYTRVLVSPAP